MTLRLALWIPWIVLGFVHPPSYVTGQWMDKVKGVKTLHIKQETTIIDPAIPGGSSVVEEEIWIRKPTFFRKTSKYPKGLVHWVMTPNRAVKISDGKIENALPIDVYGAVGIFYMPDNSRRLSFMMSQIGVATEQTKWVLRDKRVLYELGGTDNVSAFFVKDDWLPAGLKLKTKDYRLSVYLPSRFSLPYPDLAEILVDQKPVETTRVISVKENTTLADSIFDLQALRQSSGTNPLRSTSQAK